MAEARARQCPRCERQTGAAYCCGIDLTVEPRRFTMDVQKIRMVHAAARRKGLDDVDYRARLRQVGVSTCKALDRRGFGMFMAGLSSLPDAPDWVPRSRRRARG